MNITQPPDKASAASNAINLSVTKILQGGSAVAHKPQEGLKMMHTHSVFRRPDQKNLALVRALRSLRLGDAEIVSKIVDGFESWSVQIGDDCDGYLFMLIETSAACAGQLPSYLVSGKTGQVELAVINDDDCQTVDRFDDIYGLAAELAARLIAVAEQFGGRAA